MDVEKLVSESREFVDELEKHHAHWESQTHWHARKTFLRHHWEDSSDKERLLCLSFAWANVKFMGSRYPEKVMSQLRKMEEDMDDAHEMLRDAEKQLFGKGETSKPEMSNRPDYAHKNAQKKMPGTIPMLFVKSAEPEAATEATKITDQEKNVNLPIKKAPIKHTMTPNEESPISKRARVDPPNDPKKAYRPVNKPNGNFKSGKYVVPAAATVLTTKRPENVDKTPALQPNAAQLEAVQLLADLVKLRCKRNLKISSLELFMKCAQNAECDPDFRYSQIQTKDLKLFLSWAQSNDVDLNFYSGLHICEVFVEELFISNGFGANKDEAKNFAVIGALELLKAPDVKIVCAKRKKPDRTICSQLAVSDNGETDLLLPPISSQSDPDTSTVESLDKFVIWKRNGENAISTINNSAQLCRLQFDYSFEQHLKDMSWACTVRLGNQDVATSSGQNQKAAKLAAAEKALESLQATHPTIVVDQQTLAESGERMNRADVIETKQPGSQKISNDNVGNILLKKMGWKGDGGLGKLGDGISEPVSVQHSHGRSGLGKISNDESFISFDNASHVIRDYIARNMDCNLHFSSELTPDERKKIHLMARKFGLSSRSVGKAENRHVTVFRKKEIGQIVADLREAGGNKDGMQLKKAGSS